MRSPIAVVLLVVALVGPVVADVAISPDAVSASGATRTPASLEELTLGSYRAALMEIERGLAAGDWDGARRAGEALRGARVSDGRSRFEPDPSVLAAAASARDRAGASRVRSRLRALLESLEQRETALRNEADAPRLTRLAQEEAARRPRAGGEREASLDVRPPSMPEQLRDWLLAAAHWLGSWLARLWHWLTRVATRDKATGGTTGVVSVLVVVIAVLLAVAMVFSLRRRDPSEAIGEPDVASSRGDEDPLSREANEWERYAAELAGSGRRREAVRAWYHAVLVALFRAGQLHHQKGRTNWEYVAQAGPQAAWRPAFIRLTETFDREWYGREASALETLRDHAAGAREVLRIVRGGEAVA